MNRSSVVYARESGLRGEEFIDVLRRSGLADRRPIGDAACIQGMLEHATLVVTARIDGRLVGVARSVTDFHYCCYLSDLAVDRTLQGQGIGKRLIEETEACLGPRTKLILLSAPDARAFYPKIGFELHPAAFVRSVSDRESTAQRSSEPVND